MKNKIYNALYTILFVIFLAYLTYSIGYKRGINKGYNEAFDTVQAIINTALKPDTSLKVVDLTIADKRYILRKRNTQLNK